MNANGIRRQVTRRSTTARSGGVGSKAEDDSIENSQVPTAKSISSKRSVESGGSGAGTWKLGGDLSDPLDRFEDVLADPIGLIAAVDREEPAARPVVLDQRPGQSGIGPQPLSHSLVAVVLPPDQHASAVRAVLRQGFVRRH